MAKATMQLIGLDAFTAALRAQPARVRTQLEKIVAATSASMAQRARANAPVETGALKESIRHVANGLSGGVVIASGLVRGQRPDVYWQFVEFGSVHNPQFRPFLRPAAESELSATEERMRALARDIERDLTTR